MTAKDDPTRVHVAGSVSEQFPGSSIFQSLEEASSFFEQGSLGYSDTSTEGKYDGLELNCVNWQVQSLAVDEVQSSYFQDTNRFPDGTVEFDCALLMRDIDHRWYSRPDLCCGMPS